MEISWYLPFTKVFFMNICIIYTYFRMQNKKVNSIKHVFMLLCFNIFMTVIYCFLKNNLKKPFIYLIYYSIFMISFFIIMKERKPYAFTLISISMSISLLSICISTSIAFIIFKMLRFSLDSEKLVEYVVIGTIQFSLIFLFFRIKRFKDGLQFLNGSNYNNILNYMGIGISAATIVTCGIYGLHSDYGLKRITTHKSTGGSGIGFMTTFETLKQCKASLIIEEYSDLEYTKAVIIKFDNKNEYRIHSYRAEEIKNKIKDNRIIIE